MPALNISNVKNDDDISAQKKYKIELQAEINKLKSKYPEVTKIKSSQEKADPSP